MLHSLMDVSSGRRPGRKLSFELGMLGDVLSLGKCSQAASQIPVELSQFQSDYHRMVVKTLNMFNYCVCIYIYIVYIYIYIYDYITITYYISQFI